MIQRTNILTCGEYADESHGLAALDNAIENSQAFKLFREVRGEYIQPRYNVDQKTARIDRVLVPMQKAFDAGWRDGLIGVEAKKSNSKVGKIISQSLDYSRCVWHLPSGFDVVLRWIFIWPLDNPKCDLESIMAQNRIGYVAPQGKRIVFGCGGTNGITIWPDSTVTTTVLPMGRKAGSR